MTEADLNKLVEAVSAGGPAAVSEIRHLAAKLNALADDLEAADQNPFVAPGGMFDRVRMAVVGPDGTRKMSTDTHPERN